MENSEFVLSKLDSAVSRTKGTELYSLATTAGLGVASSSLALASVVPLSDPGYLRVTLVAAAGIAIVLLYLLLRRLRSNQRIRLDLLRKWQREAFIARQGIDSLAGKEVRRMVELIQIMEDYSVFKGPSYGELDSEFMRILTE